MPAALITGSSRGIGRGIALRYARDGYDVAVNYNSSEDAAYEVVDAIESETDSRAVAIGADVGDTDAATRLVSETVEALGGLDHLVNNAAINDHRYTPELSPERFDRLMDINVNSVYTITREAVPHLQASDEPEGASVVNLSSRLAFAGAPYEPHYASSKAAIVALTKSHAEEFAPEIRVNCIAPGYIETDMTDATNDEADKAERRETIPVGRLGQPSDIGDAAAFLRDAGFVAGETLQVNGGQMMY